MPLAMKPTPSRKSNFDWDVPSVIYSQSAAEFRPQGDYIGPRKSKLGRQPDPSMNPKSNKGLPILSVSRLTIQNAGLSSSSAKPNLPPVNGRTRQGKGRFSQENILTFNECQETKKILLKMPATIKKQFRSEISTMLKKKQPCKGNNKQFTGWDFHLPHPPPQFSLTGVISLGGEHRDLVEEAPQEPGTPPPLSGRGHCETQTDTYLENIMDDEVDFKSVEMQCEPLFDDYISENKSEPTILNVNKIETATISTQFDDGGQIVIEDAFEQVSTNLADVVIMESLRQLQEEYELEALRKQHKIHKCLRNREIALLKKYKLAQEKFEEQKRTLDSRKPWEENLALVISQVGYDKVKENAPSHFIKDEVDQALHKFLQEQIIEPMKAGVPSKLELIRLGHSILDEIIETTALKREADYAGAVYVLDPDPDTILPKRSLATAAPTTSYSSIPDRDGESGPPSLTNILQSDDLF